MVLTILRIFILYVLATAAVRIMGKRQIGELQPSELVITILLSEIASIPMQDTDCLLYTSPSPRDDTLSRMPSSA